MNGENNVSCPVCATKFDAPEAEPLARIPCPQCGEKVRVLRFFDHFELVETLGTGGMGTVYKAHDTQLDRFVALKLLRKELGTSPRYALQLQQEAKVAALIDHPYVVQVFSVGHDHGRVYLVMELVEGGSLDDSIEERAPLPETKVLRAGMEVAQGLRAAFEKKLIHRDVKPANILFAEDGTAKISDFGLAGIVETNAEVAEEIWATPYYVAPERLSHMPEDFRSDIYSLGASLFHALAGRPPFEGDTNSATELWALKNQPLPLAEATPSVSSKTAAVIDRMIAPEPQERFASYDELIAALAKARRRSILAGKAKNKAVLLTAAAVLLTLAAVIWFAFPPRDLEPVARPNPGQTRQAIPPLTTNSQKRGESNLSALSPSNQSSFADKPVVAKTPGISASGPGTIERERQRYEHLSRELPVWNAAVKNFRRQVAAYDFAEAAGAIRATPITDPSLRQIQAGYAQAASWLVQWKLTLIDDLNKRGFNSPITAQRTRYRGIAGADMGKIRMRLRDGEAFIPWPKFPGRTLLAISSEFAFDADRKWCCAVFAWATGSTDTAKALFDAACTAKPGYREARRFFDQTKL
jgi:serine/threonine protein kinase